MSEKVTGQNPTLYGEEIRAHMAAAFPNRTERVFYAKQEGMQVDMHLLEAKAPTDFHVLYTVGMSAQPMHLPETILPQFQALERAELILFLPPGWELNQETEKNWWPVQLLWYLARFPFEGDTWLGFGHSVPNSADYVPYDDGTAFCGSMLSALQENVSILTASDGTQINCYSVIPLYREEMEILQNGDLEGLLQKLSALKGYGMILFPDRPNVAVEETE